MSVLDFFHKLDLDIELGDEFICDGYTNMFDHFRHEYVYNENDIIEAFNDSQLYETNTPFDHNMYTKLINTDNDIIKLYNIIEPKLVCKRNRSIHINDHFGTVYTGAKQSHTYRLHD